MKLMKSEVGIGAQYVLDASLVALGRMGIKIDEEFFARYISEVMSTVSEYKPSQLDDEIRKYMRDIYYPPFKERYGAIDDNRNSGCDSCNT